MAESENAKYIVTELKWPVSNPEFETTYTTWAHQYNNPHILLGCHGCRPEG